MLCLCHNVLTRSFSERQMKIELVRVDYLNESHAKDMTQLLDLYATDPMGGGKPLAEEVKSNVVSELSKIPHAFSIICYVEGRPAGLINCFELFSTFLCRPLINIHDVIVLEEFRGRGLSHRLLQAVEAEAVSRGCCKLTLEVLSGNEIAKKSYKKFGFSAYELDPKAGSALFWEKSLKTK